MSNKYLTLVLAQNARRLAWLNILFFASIMPLILLSFKSRETIVAAVVFSGIISIILNHLFLNNYVIRKTEKAVNIAYNRIQRSVAFDDMTKIYNRRTGMERLNEEFARHDRTHEDMTLAMIDIDKFKAINDTYGHQAGDMVIIDTAKKIKESLRESDIAFRYGGEEFMIILPGSNEVEAVRPLERLRTKIAGNVVEYKGSEIRATISIGIASVLDHETNVAQVIERADKALYKAKKTGRNKVVSIADRAEVVVLRPSAGNDFQSIPDLPGYGINNRVKGGAGSANLHLN